jgi:uncharacterized protein YbjT (DUF2867 family)
MSTDKIAEKRRLIIIGGTGRQGGAVARHLRELDTEKQFEIFIVSRKPPAKSNPNDLYPIVDGFPVLQADCTDLKSLEAIFKNAYGVFGVTNPFTKRWTGVGKPEASTSEEEQGINLVKACASCNVQHFVFASVASAQDNSGVETFDKKWIIEQYLDVANIRSKTTILAPTGFMENFENPFAGLKQGVVPSLLKKGRKMQLISAEDIGWFGASAFLHPEVYLGKRIELAGDELTSEDVCNTLSRLRNGETWKTSVPPDWVFKLFIPRPVFTLKKFMDEKGTHVDIEYCRKLHPKLMNFEQFCLYKGWDTKKFPSSGMCSVM